MDHPDDLVEVDLQDPKLLRELERMALAEVRRYPAPVARTLARQAPGEAIDALIAQDPAGLAARLRERGWTVAEPD